VRCRQLGEQVPTRWTRSQNCHKSWYVADFQFKLGLTRRADECSRNLLSLRSTCVVAESGMNPSTRFAEGDSNFEVLWEDGDRVFCRVWRRSPDGDRDVLAVLPAIRRLPPSIASITNMD
jgi:hypothetical protein